MAKETTIESLEDEIRALTRKKMQLIVDADKLNKEILEVTEKYYELSDDYTKVVCFNCDGQGYIQVEEENKKVKCQICNLKCYLWMKKFKGDAK